jgi:hypothetical protein
MSVKQAQEIISSLMARLLRVCPLSVHLHQQAHPTVNVWAGIDIAKCHEECGVNHQVLRVIAVFAMKPTM